MPRLSSIGLTILLVAATTCDAATTPQAIFEEAVHLDLDAKTKLAFETYLRAARLGLPEAEFNVAVMLDSGRGVRHDVEQAAVWYARAAAHGHQRAAYNLALLYAEGDGVPRNEGMSKAWFAASGLPAAIGRHANPHLKDTGRTLTLTAPMPIAPGGGQDIAVTTGKIEIVWTGEGQPEPVRYVVELRSLDATDHHDTFTMPVATSSLVVDLPKKRGDYAWRVFAIATKPAQYLSSSWTIFHVAGEELPSAASRAEN